MDHPNLSPELNELVRRGSDPGCTVSLRQDVKNGDVVVIVFCDQEDPEKQVASIHFQVNKPAGPGSEEDAAECTLIDGTFPIEWLKSFVKEGFPCPPIGIKCHLVASCTKNPYSPLGMTMVHLHHITVGRHLFWDTWVGKDNEPGWIFGEIVYCCAVLDQQQYTSFRNGLTRQAIDAEEIKRVVAEEEAARKAQQAILRGPLRITTKNSVYFITPAGEDGNRVMRKSDGTRVHTGRLLRVSEGGSLFFLDENKGMVQTSQVQSIELLSE